MKIFYRRLPWFFALTCSLMLGAGCSKSAKAKRLLSSANRDFQAEHYDTAEIKYRGVLRLSYMNPIAVRQLGLLYYMEGRPNDAGLYLQKSLQQDPTNLQVRVRLAQTLATVGQVKGAAMLALQVVQTAPDNEDALLLLVDLARSTNDLAGVRRQIELLPTGPDSAAHYAALAWIDLRSHNMTEGEAEAQQALTINPKLVSANLALSAVAAERKDAPMTSNYLFKAAELSPMRSSTRIKFADYLFKNGAPAEALHVIEEMTRQAPDYLPSWINLMHLYFAQRDYDQCADVTARILSRDAANYEALLEAGNVSLAKRDAATAIITFKRLDSAHKRIPLVKYRLAMAYLMNGETANAIGSLNEALEANHNYAPATILMAELDIRSGNSSSAINLLVPLVKKTPQEGQAHLLLATAYLARKQMEDAQGVYREMANVFPNNPEVPRLIGAVYELEGDDAKAREAFEQSLALSADYLPTLEMITDMDLNAKRYTEAQNRLAAVIAQDPQLAEPWLLQGKVYWAAGKTNQAESAMSKAVDLDPGLPSAYLSLARLYIESGQVPQALARLTALVNKTNDATALLEIGELHQQAGQADEARDAYEKLLTFEPRFGPALNNLAYLYSEHYKNFEKAAEMASRAREVRPGDPFVADTLGWILYKQGQYPRALTLLQESLEKQPNAAEVQMHLGMTYYMLEDEDLARMHLEQALSSHDDYEGKEEARKCLALLTIDPATATPAQIEMLRKQLKENPRDPAPLNRLAAIDELHGNMDKAAEAYQTLIAQDPQDWKAMIKLARLYAGPLHDVRKALDLAKSAHEIAPTDPRAAATLGELVYTSGDYSWALSLLEEAASQLPTDPTARYYLALAYYAVGRVSEADSTMNDAVNAAASLPNLDQAKQFLAFRAAAQDAAHSEITSAQVRAVLEKDPHFLAALMLSGILAERQGDYKQAGQTYEQILADYPKFTPAMRQLALLYTWHSGDETKAYELGDKARAAFPDDLELARTLGILAYRRAEYQRSAQLLRDSSRQFDNDGELLYYLGMDYYQLKQRKESKETLQRAVALNVPSPLVVEAKRVLGELK